MTRRVSKHGTTYTVGSQSTYGGWEPRTCLYGDRCTKGGKITLSRDTGGLWFYLDDISGARWSVHMDCFRELGAWPGYPQAPA